MLRADNTTVIVLALQEREGPDIPMHQDEIVVDMATGVNHLPFPGTTYNTCEVPQVSEREVTLSAFGKKDREEETHPHSPAFLCA